MSIFRFRVHDKSGDAARDGSYNNRLLRFTTPDVLIVDDLGLRELAHDEPVDLYEVIRRR